MMSNDPLSPPCDEWVLRISSLHRSPLSDDEQAQFLAHARHCRACAAAYEDYSAIDTMILEYLLDLPGEDLAEQVDAYRAAVLDAGDAASIPVPSLEPPEEVRRVWHSGTPRREEGEDKVIRERRPAAPTGDGSWLETPHHDHTPDPWESPSTTDGGDLLWLPGNAPEGWYCPVDLARTRTLTWLETATAVSTSTIVASKEATLAASANSVGVDADSRPRGRRGVRTRVGLLEHPPEGARAITRSTGHTHAGALRLFLPARGPARALHLARVCLSTSYICLLVVGQVLVSLGQYVKAATRRDSHAAAQASAPTLPNPAHAPSTEAVARLNELLEQLSHADDTPPLMPAILRPLSGGPPVLGPQRRMVEGRVAIMVAIAQLLDAAPGLPQPHANSIVVTWQGKGAIGANTDELQREWWMSLRGALERGWDVVHLVRRPADSTQEARVTGVAHLIRTLLGTRGLYTPFLLPPLSHEDTADDLVYVPGVGCLTTTATHASGGEIRAVFEPAGPGLDRVSAELAQLRAQAAAVYHQIYPPYSAAFNEAISRVEECEGERFLVMSGLSESTVPPELHEARAQALLAHLPAQSDKAQVVRQIVANRKRREKAIAAQVQQWRFREICPRSAIERFVRDGVYSEDDMLLHLGAPALTRDERRQHLEYLVERLRRYPNYALILLDDDQASICRNNYLAKPGKAVLLEFWAPNAEGHREQVDVEITEPRIVTAFHDNQFWQVFRTLPEGYKEAVIQFLGQQIDVLAHGHARARGCLRLPSVVASRLAR